MLSLSPAAYIDRSIEALSLAHLGLGFSKSVVFGGAGGHHRLLLRPACQRNAAGVGVATTLAVVASIVGIIVVDAIFAICANALGI